jgi:hypothetical protein
MRAGTLPASHGICPRCQAKLDAQIAAAEEAAARKRAYE